MPIYALGDHRPQLPPDGSFWVAPGAHVVGRVTLGVDASIWFGAVLRGDNEPIVIGDGSNVQENAALHADPGFPLTIGPGCTIGHQATLHGCTIGANSLVGMGATILNGATIGANCLVGAGALITEGKTFPDNSLVVGTPARALRALDAAAIEKIRTETLRYVTRWRRYASELRRID